MKILFLLTVLNFSSFVLAYTPMYGASAPNQANPREWVPNHPRNHVPVHTPHGHGYNPHPQHQNLRRHRQNFGRQHQNLHPFGPQRHQGQGHHAQSRHSRRGQHSHPLNMESAYKQNPNKAVANPEVEKEVKDGVDRMAEEIVEAVVNRLEAAEAMAVEMEAQGVDPNIN